MSEALLGELLAAWRDTHDPELEPLIARLGEAVARARGPIVAAAKELERAWHAVAENNDSADVDRLIDTPWPATWRPALARITALVEFPPDPRMQRVALAARRYDASSITYALVDAIVALLARSPSRDVLTAITVIGAPSGERFARVRKAVAALGPRAADAELLARGRRATADSVDVDSLFAELARAPGDLGLRTVLADALQQRGDPRGEFITIQMAPPTPRSRARAEVLLRAHADTWTGALPRLRDRRFERGFLVGASCTADAATLVASAACPEWSTVEHLELGTTPPPELLARMPLLRVLELGDAALAELASSGPHPTIRVLGRGATWLPRDRRAFPNLSVLLGAWCRSWSLDRYRRVLRAAVELGLHAVAFAGFPQNRVAEALRLRTEGPPELVFTFDHTIWGSGWRVRAYRDADRADLAWSGKWSEDLRIVEWLSEGLVTEFAIDVPNGKPRTALAARIDMVHRELDSPMQRRIRGTSRCQLVARFDGAPVDVFAHP